MSGTGMTESIWVSVIGGYLGTGKTTLVNHVLRHATGRVAVLVNDFGSIGIDSDLIVASDGDTITLANGCICCSLVDGFASALDTLRSRPDPPDRLFIEASGVSDPEQVAAYGHLPGLRLDAVITVADAETVRAQAQDRYVGDIVTRQLEVADVIVLNKADLVSEVDLADTKLWLEEMVGGASVLEAVHAELPLPVLLWATETARSATARGELKADDRFEQWSFSTDRPVDAEHLDEALAALPPGVIRAKGFVRSAGNPDEQLLVQLVGKRGSITPDGPWAGGDSRLELIGLRGTPEPGNPFA